MSVVDTLARTENGAAVEKLLGRDIAPGHTVDGYCLGGTFTVESIEPESHRTSTGEYARSAYDHAGRGMVFFDGDLYPVI